MMRARDEDEGRRASPAKSNRRGASGATVPTDRPASRRSPLEPWRESLFTGVLGASVVSFWFLLLDTVAGDPLFTPRTLGAFFAGVEGETLARGEQILLVLGYTVLHFAAFIAVALGAVFFLQVAEREPALLVLFVLLFEVLEIGFYGMISILHEIRLLDGLEWERIAIGNLLASGLMGRHLWYAHPSLRFGLAQAVSR